MPINQSIYPNNPQVRQLPVFLVGIGGSQYQEHVHRPEGYYWNQLLYSVKGQGYLQTDSTTGTISEGCYFFLPNTIPHEYYPLTESWEVRWVVFDGYACSQITKELNLTRPIVLKPDDNTALDKLYNKMFVAQKTDKMFGDYTCSGLIYEYLLAFHQQVISKNYSVGTSKSELLMPLLSYIDDHFADDLSMSVLAEVADISPQHLCRIFKETMHMRPTEYLTYKRLGEAKALLRHSDLSIAKVGALCGFPDPGYFSTIFKRYEGMSPVEYRKKIGAI